MKKIFLTVIVLITGIAMSCSNSEAVKAEKPVAEKTLKVVGHELAPGVIQVPNNQVCMVNDAFKTSEQIPVVVNGKTYYGCCQGCVDALKTNENARVTTDLLSGNVVDKSTAITVLKQGSKEEVLYFASKQNAIKYVFPGTSADKYIHDLNQKKLE